MATHAAPSQQPTLTRAPRFRVQPILAVLLLLLMGGLAGSAALRESVTFDELAHIGAGLSYWQKLDLRLNEEHPPLAKLLASLPLVFKGTHADYSNPSWTQSRSFFSAFMGEWVFGEYVLTRWNDQARVLAWSRFPMLLLTLALGYVIYVYGTHLGGAWGGILPLLAYITAPVFLAFGPLVLTDVAITLFSLLSLWTFAELWQNPTHKNTIWFALCFAGALLSKFSAGILLFAFVAVSLSTRWRPLSGQPESKQDARLWRRKRWRATIVGILWAAVVVYVVYFLFSWHQTSDVLYLLGRGPAFAPLRRLLMPPWLYLRGVLMVLITGNRPTFLLGHGYPHGVWFYFPVLFFLKSPLGFLGLLALTAVLALRWKRLAPVATSVIPDEVRMHWRVLWVSLIVFTGMCILSHLNVSFRHFSVPLVLLMLLLAPLPALLQRFRQLAPRVAVAAIALTVALAAGDVIAVVRQYPYYFPYVNALSLGRPAYTLMSDSNVDWNQSLPDVRRFAVQHGEQKLKIDEYGWTETDAVVPQSELWDCQQPSDEDRGHWVVVSANMIVDSHNCHWLMQYPHQAIAAGSMYAVQLPPVIPPAGSPGGPPASDERRQLFGTFYREPRIMFQEMVRDPNKLSDLVKEMQAQWQQEMDKRKRKK